MASAEAFPTPGLTATTEAAAVPSGIQKTKPYDLHKMEVQSTKPHGVMAAQKIKVAIMYATTVYAMVTLYTCPTTIMKSEEQKVYELIVGVIIMFVWGILLNLVFSYW